jgi:FAD/FMN-containing dehydrogenase/Fe-S oxidoreductase
LRSGFGEWGGVLVTVVYDARPRVRDGSSRLERRLRAALEGDVHFDAFSRGRYATDASFYQIMPLGVIVPTGDQDLEAALTIAREEGVPVLARGGGTSQSGQTVAEALVIDFSRHFDAIEAVDVEARTAVVRPGLVLDEFNRRIRSTGLWFPVDVSTSSRATLGGMAANNSCGSRSLRYGIMRDHVSAIDLVMPDGTSVHAASFDPALVAGRDTAACALTADLHSIALEQSGALQDRLPKVLRRVGGYNLDALLPGTASPSGERSRKHGDPPNLAHLFVGSEGTLGTFTRLHLKLSPVIGRKALGVCHFPTFYSAMDATQHIVKLGPVAVELVDRTMIELARSIPMFEKTTARFVKGDPEALLMVEFAEETDAANLARLADLEGLMADLGFPGSVVQAIDADLQAAIWGVRTEGLNIMMSMRDERKPVSFIEDMAVPLHHLAEFTATLSEVFARNGTTGTWYAHASEGCLHVRPVLNLKQELEVRRMRAIAEEAFDLVRRFKGSHSGEHGDGLVRSEFNAQMFGPELTAAHVRIKQRIDPHGRLNPGKIVNPPKMDDRSLFRFAPDYAVMPLDTALDWSDWSGIGGAVEMCNNNGACRKLAGGVMCPSYRVTRNERDVTRGRANTLRLALSGQLGPDALTSDAMAETMQLCVSCKGCRSECPTGVDMARLKVEVQAQRVRRHGLALRDRAIAYLPRYGRFLSSVAPLVNWAMRVPGVSELAARMLGFSPKRSLPQWQRPLEAGGKARVVGPADGFEVVLLADTFNRSFDPDIISAAVEVLTTAGCRVHLPEAAGGGEPLCCGRTFLSVGLVDEARAEARRVVETLAPFVERGVPVIGLEPSCLLTLRDEFLAILPGDTTQRLADHALLFEEFLERHLQDGRLKLDFKMKGEREVLLHGHCHQKAFGAFSPVQKLLKRVPGMKVTVVETSCCGMAGAFGYAAETYDVSMKMAEVSLLPAVRAAPADAIVVADGTSCRHQISDGAARQAVHAALVIRDALS